MWKNAEINIYNLKWINEYMNNQTGKQIIEWMHTKVIKTKSKLKQKYLIIISHFINVFFKMQAHQAWMLQRLSGCVLIHTDVTAAHGETSCEGKSWHLVDTWRHRTRAHTHFLLVEEVVFQLTFPKCEMQLWIQSRHTESVWQTVLQTRSVVWTRKSCLLSSCGG